MQKIFRKAVVVFMVLAGILSIKQNAYSEGCTICSDNVPWAAHALQSTYPCAANLYYSTRTCPTNYNEIKIDSIIVMNPQTCNLDSVLFYAEKKILQSSLSLFTSTPSGGTIRMKKPSCYNPTTFLSCDTNCYSTDYTITKYSNTDSIWYSISQSTNNTNSTCGTTGGSCLNKSNIYVSENTILSKFPISQSDNPNDYTLCSQDCFWTLHGNSNVTNTNYMGSFNNQDVIFKRFASEKMRITENGIGIGTKTPIGKLDINFNRWGWQNSDPIPSFPKISFDATKVVSDVDNIANPYIAFYRQTGFTTVCANNNPNFDSYNWRIELDGFNVLNDWPTYGALNFKTSAPTCAGNENPTTKMTLLQNGNVGIGTMNPKEKLHVMGKVRINQTGTGLNLAPINQHSDYQLAVEGKIVAKEIIVTLDNWADFVFDENYKLKDLNELEKEIKQNKRLPNIPSEKEIKESGVNLGEMQSKMMQKIEELTLYLIEQQKKINELETKINKNKE